jgi:hypothetical protein
VIDVLEFIVIAGGTVALFVFLYRWMRREP